MAPLRLSPSRPALGSGIRIVYKNKEMAD
jgi:hypothetical protein